MLYSEYFGFRIKNDGVPKLNKEQFQRMMNIVFIEGMITSFSESSLNDKKIMERNYRHTKSLNELTNRKKPEVLYNEFIRLSK